MSNPTLTKPADLAEPTEARFTMRSLFVAMAVVALLAALLGPLVRGLDADAQIRLLVTWGAWLVAIVAWVSYQVRQRFEAERLAGATLLRLPMFDERIPSSSPGRRWFNILANGFMSLFFILVISQMAVESPAGISNGLWYFLFMVGVWGGLSVWWAARIVTMLWWRNSIRFCENGVLWDRRFAPWNFLVEHRWDPSKGSVLELRGIDQHGIDLSLKVPVAADQREAVEAVLHEAAAGLRAATEASFSELGRIPISVAVRHRHFWRYVAGVLLRIGLIIAAIIFVSSVGIREFNDTLFPALILGALLSWFRWRWLGKSAGAPLVRLVGRRGWAGFVVILAAAAVCYFAAVNYRGMNTWPIYLAGIGFWWAAFSGAIFLTAAQFDLRENGVVLPGAFYWPWDKVRVARWDRERTGRLVLAHGWRRIVATVPPEQREAVDAVLREKVDRRTVQPTDVASGLTSDAKAETARPQPGESRG